MKTLSEIDMWRNKPVAEGYVTVQYFFKWLVGKDVLSPACPDSAFDELMELGFKKWFADADELKTFIRTFKDYTRIRVWTFMNGNEDADIYKYTLMVRGLSHWDTEHPDEKYFECEGIKSNKKLTKK